ncbi:MAG TPA: hypothetical protein VLA99_00310 [Nitrospiraceae bacterium]|nr:hypothetical protein [Nitrospiraceae bacterium]
MMFASWWIRYSHRRKGGLWALGLLVIIIPGVGCASAPGDRRGETMPEPVPPLIGHWEKMTHSACSERYPDRIQFLEGRSYSGHKASPGTFAWWDVGTYEITGPGHINISTANDAIITYRFDLSEDVLAFRDPDGCEFKYRKVG